LPEFALVLPVFILIMLIAVDFGRLFGSWVAIHNAARIAANSKMYRATKVLRD